MITSTRLIYILGAAGIPAAVRFWVKAKNARREKLEGVLPLFDAVALEIAMTRQAGEDSDVLAEMRGTFDLLNQRTFASEFWNLDEQLVKYYSQVPDASKPTVQAAIIRMIESQDRWLQSVGVNTASGMALYEALPAIEALKARLVGELRESSAEEALFLKSLDDAIQIITADEAVVSSTVS